MDAKPGFRERKAMKILRQDENSHIETERWAETEEATRDDSINP